MADNYDPRIDKKYDSVVANCHESVDGFPSADGSFVVENSLGDLTAVKIKGLNTAAFRDISDDPLSSGEKEDLLTTRKTIKDYVDSRSVITLVKEGAEDGTITCAMDGQEFDVPVHNLKSAAFKESIDFVTGIKQGEADGTICFTKEDAEYNVEIKGLQSAAFHDVSEFVSQSDIDGLSEEVERLKEQKVSDIISKDNSIITSKEPDALSAVSVNISKKENNILLNCNEENKEGLYVGFNVEDDLVFTNNALTHKNTVVPQEGLHLYAISFDKNGHIKDAIPYNPVVFGSGKPSDKGDHIGQLYIDTNTNTIYYWINSWVRTSK